MWSRVWFGGDLEIESGEDDPCLRGGSIATAAAEDDEEDADDKMSW